MRLVPLSRLVTDLIKSLIENLFLIAGLLFASFVWGMGTVQYVLYFGFNWQVVGCGLFAVGLIYYTAKAIVRLGRELVEEIGFIRKREHVSRTLEEMLAAVADDSGTANFDSIFRDEENDDEETNPS